MATDMVECHYYRYVRTLIATMNRWIDKTIIRRPLTRRCTFVLCAGSETSDRARLDIIGAYYGECTCKDKMPISMISTRVQQNIQKLYLTVKQFYGGLLDKARLMASKLYGKSSSWPRLRRSGHEAIVCSHT